jgi:hypothetical protein
MASGVGGKPVRSKQTRRINAARSASLEIDSPALSSRCCTKRSMAVRTMVFWRINLGTVGLTSERNAQWRASRFVAGSSGLGSPSAPASIHRRSIVWSAADNGSSGGISPAEMRCQIKLSSKLPATIAGPFSPPSAKEAALLKISPCPWQ